MKIVNECSVDYIDHLGSDLSVVNAARVSFDKTSSYNIIGFTETYDDNGCAEKRTPIKQLDDKDVKLIHYLAEHNHWSPFSHAFASFRIKAPIFVARQLVKHHVGLSWNEVSRRYVDSEPEFYMPTVWRGRADNVKQGSGDVLSNDQPCVDINLYTTGVTTQCVQMYRDLLDVGMCPEQARMFLPQNMMTEWIWSGSLYAFARVCNLRLDSHTQKETQEVAKLLDKHMKMLYPVSWNTLVKGE